MHHIHFKDHLPWLNLEIFHHFITLVRGCGLSFGGLSTAVYLIVFSSIYHHIKGFFELLVLLNSPPQLSICFDTGNSINQCNMSKKRSRKWYIFLLNSADINSSLISDFIQLEIILLKGDKSFELFKCRNLSVFLEQEQQQNKCVFDWYIMPTLEIQCTVLLPRVIKLVRV